MKLFALTEALATFLVARSRTQVHDLIVELAEGGDSASLKVLHGVLMASKDKYLPSQWRTCVFAPLALTDAGASAQQQTAALEWLQAMNASAEMARESVLAMLDDDEAFDPVRAKALVRLGMPESDAEVARAFSPIMAKILQRANYGSADGGGRTAMELEIAASILAAHWSRVAEAFELVMVEPVVNLVGFVEGEPNAVPDVSYTTTVSSIFSETMSLRGAEGRWIEMLADVYGRGSEAFVSGFRDAVMANGAYACRTMEALFCSKVADGPAVLNPEEATAMFRSALPDPYILSLASRADSAPGTFVDQVLNGWVACGTAIDEEVEMPEKPGTHPRKFKGTLLHKASELGRAQLVAGLLAHGCDPKKKAQYIELAPDGTSRVVRDAIEIADTVATFPSTLSNPKLIELNSQTRDVLRSWTLRSSALRLIGAETTLPNSSVASLG